MKFLAISLLVAWPLGAAGQYTISGQIDLDSTWEKEVYLSVIPALGDLYRCSPHLIVAKAAVLEDGSFTIEGDVFPDQPHIVRLHVNKKHDPVATLIIGGQNENHCFLVLSRNAQLQLKEGQSGLFDHFNVIGDPTNEALYSLDSTIQYFAVLDTAFSYINYKNMVKAEQAKTLLNYADTTQFLLAALYAIDAADWGANREEIQRARVKVTDRFPAHPYLSKAGRSGLTKLPYLQLSAGFLLLLSLMTGLYFFLNKRRSPALKRLSVQEKKILAFLQEGKTNKEIAHQLHIELTTVKSHVYNIYKKLKISSRKDVGKFKR